MKKFLFAAALCASLTASAAIEEGFINVDALFSHGSSSLIAEGTILSQTSSVILSVENTDGFGRMHTSYTISDTISVSKRSAVITVNGESYFLPVGIEGAMNGPSVTVYYPPQKSGCQYHYSVTKDGWLIVPSRIKSHKPYGVYEGTFDMEMTPVAYTLGMFLNSADYPDIPQGIYSLPSDENGYLDLNAPDIENYLMLADDKKIIRWPISIFTQNVEASFAGYGTGALVFPVKAGKDYIVFCQGAKMQSCGYIFVDSNSSKDIPDVSIAYITDPDDILTITGSPQTIKSHIHTKIFPSNEPAIFGANSTYNYDSPLEELSYSCGFQFDLTLPVGLSLNDIIYCDNYVSNNWKISHSKLSNGDYRVIGYSTDGTSISGRTIRMNLSSDENLTRSKILCHDVIISIDDKEFILDDHELLVTGYEVNLNLPKTLAEGETHLLPNPVENAGDDVTYQWGTNNSYVATVENNSLLKALNPGKVEISLSLNDPEFSKTYSYVLKVIAALWGDVDGNKSIDVADMMAMVNHILGREPENFDEHLADIDRNGRINIVDLTSLIKLILSQPQEESPQNMRAFAPAANSEISFGEAATISDDRIQIPVVIESSKNYSALQAEIVIPDGMTIESITLADGLRDHAIDYAAVSDNSSRMVIYSASLAELPANQSSALATVTLRGKAHTGDTVYLTNAIACTTDCTSYSPGNAAVELSEHSGIENVLFDSNSPSAPIYNLQGIKVDSNSLPAGIYIQNGRKFIVH